MLGAREPKHYGSISLTSIEEKIQTLATQHNVKVECFQANSEEKLINKIHKSFQQVDFILINPAAYTHYSYAIADCLRNIQKPKIEVHISNIYAREEFRQKSVTAAHCSGVISGFGLDGYRLAVLSLK